MLTLAAKAMKNNHSFSFSNYQMLSEINKENVISFYICDIKDILLKNILVWNLKKTYLRIYIFC